MEEQCKYRIQVPNDKCRNCADIWVCSNEESESYGNDARGYRKRLRSILDCVPGKCKHFERREDE